MASESETNTAAEEGKTFDISCPHCGETLLGNESIVGLTVVCPYCSKTFTAPAAPAESPTPQRQETPLPQSDTATSTPTSSQKKTGGQIVGKRRFQKTGTTLSSLGQNNASTKNVQTAGRAGAKMNASGDAKADKDRSRPILNFLSCVLCVFIAAFFALRTFFGIDLMPSFGISLWGLALFCLGYALFVVRQAKRKNFLTAGVCGLCLAIVIASFYYDNYIVAQNGLMGRRENQLKVGELLVTSLSQSVESQGAFKVGKYTEVQIDLDSLTTEEDSVGVETFEGKVCVEMFPRKKGSGDDDVKYETTPILVWYDVKGTCDSYKKKIVLTESRRQGDKFPNGPKRANGSARESTANVPMGLRENQLKVGEQLAKFLSQNEERTKVFFKVGKCTDVQIDMNSLSRKKSSDGEPVEAFKGKVRVEMFPRRKGASQYETSPILVWFNVYGSYNLSKKSIDLLTEKIQPQEDNDWNMLLVATGLDVYEVKSKLAVAQMQGRRLCEALIAESIEGVDIWPHLSKRDGLVPGKSDEVYGNVYASSTEYFKKLFEIDRQTSAEWKPYIDGKLLEYVWGIGATPAPPGRLRPENVGWIVVAGASGIDNIPAFVSANVNPDMLIVKGTVDTARYNRQIPLGKANGAPMDLYMNKGAVIVYNDGSAKTFMAEEFTIRNVYNNKVVRIPEGGTLKYLKP